ncbi:DUF3883 domain-containing protein [Marine Group I thaumarchaeote]|uniref:DUF3883 domain-containing protein n=1 Tax=Marine Group I thaumarchaeote TaxID=2511932 RepID=A0A7K4NM01_9ARCH|nr:DUF3883 domain-containing protein [Marine Group I thaumarchaeote]
MEIQIDNILDLLKIIKEYQGSGKADKQFVTSTYNHKNVRRAAFPNYSALEKLCAKLGVFNVSGKSVELTVLGEKILKTLDKGEIEEIFVLECFLNGELSRDVLHAASHFYVNDDNTMWCPKKDLFELFTETEIFPILYETKFLKKDGGKVTIDQKFLPALNIELKKIVRKKLAKSQVQLDKELERERETKKRIGEIAENIVLEFEKKRLGKNGCVEVRRISQEYANAGYDIESPDRLIEVKGSTGDDFDIFWSQNEIETARENRDKYWIYFVPGVNIKSKTSKDPILIPDPITNVLDSDQYKEKKETLHLVKNNSKEN